jgi:hypothetical protein
MTTSNTAPTAAHLNLLAALTDADLLAPITTDALPTEQPVPSFAITAPATVRVPALDTLRAQAASLEAATSTADLPPRTLIDGAIQQGEQVSYLLRTKGTVLSEGLRRAVGESIRSADDLEYALRVFAAHAVNALIGNRYADLLRVESEAAVSSHTDWQDRVRAAALGEVAAVQASAHLSAAEFKHLLELVDTDRCGMAQNLVGPDVDVKALAAGRGLNWRDLATSWANAAGSRATVTFEAAKTEAGWHSYNIEVQPGAGWVLSVHSDSTWFPIEASAPAMARAVAERNRVMGIRAMAAKGAPYLGVAFPDALRGAL